MDPELHLTDVCVWGAVLRQRCERGLADCVVNLDAAGDGISMPHLLQKASSAAASLTM